MKNVVVVMILSEERTKPSGMWKAVVQGFIHQLSQDEPLVTDLREECHDKVSGLIGNDLTGNCKPISQYDYPHSLCNR